MFANSKKVTTFAPEIEREILDKKDGPFVYRLGRKIFILERGVRFPHGLPNKKAIDKSMAFLFGSPALCRVSGGQCKKLRGKFINCYLCLQIQGQRIFLVGKLSFKGST